MSTNTINYNLVKPTDDEDADISVINANMDMIDSALKELDSNKEVAIKTAIEKTSLADDDSMPLLDNADSKTKMISFTNIKATLKTYFDTFYNKTVIANNLTTTEEGSALDATQGKVLAETVFTLNTSLGDITENLNEVSETVENLTDSDITLSATNQILYGGINNVNQALKSACNGSNNVLVKFNLCYPNTTTPVPGARTCTISGTSIHNSITFTTDGTKDNITMLLPIGTYTITPPSNMPLPFVNTDITFVLTLGMYYKEQYAFNYGIRTIDASGTYNIDNLAISNCTSVEFCIIGGGGAGAGHGNSGYVGGTGGGGGGYVKNQSVAPSIFTEVNTINATIGTGGVGSSSDGAPGGISSLTVGGTTYSSSGGSGGSGSSGGSGGSGGGAGAPGTASGYNLAGSGGSNGASGGAPSTGTTAGTGQGNTTKVFGSGVAYGAGGGGGNYGTINTGYGGSAGGGDGGYNGSAGNPATAYGSGGGGASTYSQNRFGGSGYQGAIFFKITI